jgi:threonylcarbamoyladenosine tRNA methylthiotransferase MtaB
MKMRYFTEAHAGQSRKVLFEGRSRNGMMEGYTDNYIKVTIPHREDYVNRIVAWRL